MAILRQRHTAVSGWHRSLFHDHVPWVDGRHVVALFVLLVTLGCGLLNLVFIANAVVRQARGKGLGGIATLALFSVLSVLTAAFTIWQLALAAGISR
jgi:hypothetical protein